MSQALALLPDALPTSALVGAFQGALAVPEVDPAALADDDDHDLQGITPAIPRINVNAQAGRFHEPGLSKEDIDASPRVLEGIILARAESSIHFVPQEAKGAHAKELGYGKLLEAEKWLCRNPSAGTEPHKAELNPSLTEEQHNAARGLKLGGATGRGCTGCPAAIYRQFADKQVRLCSQAENLVWLDSKLEEPVVLQVSAAVSVSRLRRWMAETYRLGSKKLRLCAFVVRLRFQSEKMDGKDVWQLVAEVVKPVPADMLRGLVAYRELHTYMLERATRETAAAPDTFEAPALPRTPAASSGDWGHVPPPSDHDAEASESVLGGML